MKTRQFAGWMLLAAMFVSSLLWTGCVEDVELRFLAAATVNAPDSLVGRRFAFTEPSGTYSMLFLENNRYELTRSGGAVESGFFTATRPGADRWSVVATSLDAGVITTQFDLLFTSPGGGSGTATVAGDPRRSFTFEESTGNSTTGNTTTGETNVVVRLAPASLVTVDIRNEISQTGPSSYRIQFTTNGLFTIELPGYGSGTYLYTPSTNTAKLILTYGADLAGDVDDLNLEFKAASGSATPSLQSGTQRISGQSYPVQGTFVYTGVPQ